MSKPPAEVQPYVWHGDILVSTQDGQEVATIDDFPELKRMRALAKRVQHRLYGTPLDGDPS